MDQFKKNIKPTELPSKLEIECISCGNKCLHEKLSGVQEENVNLDVDVYVWDDFALYQCTKCHKIRFVHQYRDSMETNYKVSDLSWAFLYPMERVSLGIDLKIPSQLRSLHTEARKALREKMFVLTGVAVRSMIECVCADKDIDGRNLQVKIDKLEENGLINKPAKRVLNNLRFMGNRAAHRFESHSETELELALSIAEHLIDYIYRRETS